MSDAGRDDGDLQILREGVHRAGSADQRFDHGLGLIQPAGGVQGRLYEGIVRIHAGGMLVGQALDFNVFEAFRVEVPADLFGDIEGVLPWHQPEIDLGGCGGRQDGLGAGRPGSRW